MGDACRDKKGHTTELSEGAARKTRATVDTLAAQFDAVFDGAMASEQFGPAAERPV
jgi:hypothetical protein